ncbi:hypothetical protein BD779DRAFT_369631 [Infundibulicybe gibba]|nr:hypothetical protein BD779DRAFT_369631 [Infundibulicybe gibba]
MTTLPSFEELMASLGLDQAVNTSVQSLSPRPSPSPPPRPSSTRTISPARSNTSTPVRDNISIRRVARYTPYSPPFPSPRRGSLSSLSASAETQRSPTRSQSTSPRIPSSPLQRRRSSKSGRGLTVNVYGSRTDLAANTPISIYVRRKTPGTSPTSPTFPRELRCDSPGDQARPFTLPTLPPLFPQSPSSDSFPITPNSDTDLHPLDGVPSFNKLDVLDGFTRRSRRHTGIRISSPSHSADLGDHYLRRRTVANI